MNRETPLNTANIETLPEEAGIYVLKHGPTGRLYFGSTTNLRARMRQWFYQIGNIENANPLKSSLPALIRVTLHGGQTPYWGAQHGHGTEQWRWLYKVIRLGVPDDFKPKGHVYSKPEWPLIEALARSRPELVLNDIRPPKGNTTTQRGNRGVSPLRYLRGRLGFDNFRYASGQPEHHHEVDPRKLPAGVGSTDVPFATYLLRSMTNCEGKKNLNPSPAAIQELFRHWRRYVPTHDPVFSHPEPGTINDALNVPVPAGYQIPPKYPRVPRGVVH